MAVYPFKKIEKKWQKYWRDKKIYEPDLKRAKNPFYNLMMFPYPSGEGLHIGNMYAFVGSDIYGRYARMNGNDVFEPIGLDGFGIHSENYALKVRKHPVKLAKITERNFYRQLGEIGNGFSWKAKLETYDPNYYKWTQWIFIRMFKNGLAYRKKSEVNWCPSCKTVLADEQVVSGECERCGTLVVKKELEQWFFKITDYAERLLKDLEKIDWSEKVKIAQRNWIGRSDGAQIEFKIQKSPKESKLPTRQAKIKITDKNSKFIKVFTTRPDTLFGCTYLALSPEHQFLENNKSQIKNWDEVKDYIARTKKKSDPIRTGLEKDKSGVELKGIKAINPASGEEIPIWISDYVLAEYGSGAIMAVPAHDQRDFEFAKKYDLPVKIVVCPNYPEKTCPVLDEAYEGDGYLVGSARFDGMDSEKAIGEITKWLAEKSAAKKETHYHLRDWLISRQRYWGSPIPLVFCESCHKKLKGISNFQFPIKSKILNSFNKGELLNPGWFAVSDKDLPVKLPFIKNFRPKGKGVSPLATVKSFYEVKCPKCGGKARRETDVSDTFLDSSWYYYGYLAKENSKLEIGNAKFRSRAKRWLPVDMYIGGAEHSVLHLLYTRFITKVFYDWGLIDFSAKGGSASGGDEPFKKFRAHGLIIKDGAKMSKSKGNIVVPDKYINLFGADVLRMYLMFLGPFKNGGDFRNEGIKGIVRFLDRTWRLKSKLQIKTQNYSDSRIEKIFHQSIKKITEDIENLRYNTAISQLMILLNEMENPNQELSTKNCELFLKLLAPFAPHLTEELWHRLGNKSSIHESQWPSYDAKKIKEDFIQIPIQINGKLRAIIEISSGAGREEVKEKSLNHPKVQHYVGGARINKVIIVPQKIVNILTDN